MTFDSTRIDSCAVKGHTRALRGRAWILVLVLMRKLHVYIVCKVSYGGVQKLSIQDITCHALVTAELMMPAIWLVGYFGDTLR